MSEKMISQDLRIDFTMPSAIGGSGMPWLSRSLQHLVTRILETLFQQPCFCEVKVSEGLKVNREFIFCRHFKHPKHAKIAIY